MITDGIYCLKYMLVRGSYLCELLLLLLVLLLLLLLLLSSSLKGKHLFWDCGIDYDN